MSDELPEDVRQALAEAKTFHEATMILARAIDISADVVGGRISSDRVGGA